MSVILTNIAITKAIGAQIARKEILCPVCAEDDKLVVPECVLEQTLSVYGDREYILFCPHCELTLELTVISRPSGEGTSSG